MMRKRISFVVLAVLLCGLPVSAFAQVGGKWKRITNYSNKTGEELKAVSVRSLSTVLEHRVEHTATFVIAGGTEPLIMIDFGGQFVYSEYKDLTSESWLDDANDNPLKVRWSPSMGNTLQAMSVDQLLKGLEKAKLFHISFWASDTQRYVHTFPVAGLAAHMGFLGITTKSKPAR